jgi:deoxyribodipyrimidine photo-lyase
MNDLAIVWFRQDLRLTDNPAFFKAFSESKKIVPIFIIDDLDAANCSMGEASRWWLHRSLNALNEDLEGELDIFNDSPLQVFKKLILRLKPKVVYANRGFEPWRREQESQLQSLCHDYEVLLDLSDGNYLVKPESITKDDGTPYKVFTPFYRRGCLRHKDGFAITIEKPKGYKAKLENSCLGTAVDLLKLLPHKSWHDDLAKEWQPGERGALKRLQTFTEIGVKNYKKGRDYPSKNFASRLSAHMHFGEISPRNIWKAVADCSNDYTLDDNIDHFFSELGWREFSVNLLFHNKKLPTQNLQSKFDRFPWANNPDDLLAWQTGTTGIPIVDAGMRELWQTGYMHNRVRMVVGSFLVKNLLIDWRLGASWFWDTLVDADLANNSASWQWVAGSGADAAPFFRIFNPVTQAKKFDPDGMYIKRYVPELAKLDPPELFAPWEAKTERLEEKGFILGQDYPFPIVDIAVSRQRALEAFKHLKGLI